MIRARVRVVRVRAGRGYVLLASALVAACAGPSAVTRSATGSESTPVRKTFEHIPWRNMTRGERIDFMVTTVLPTMKAEFVAFDAKRFARMDCATCHGDGVETASYALPNPKLPRLLEPDLFAKHRQLTPETTRFMLEKVEPKLAALLEVPEFDPATRKGLSCYNCHPRELEPGKPVPAPAEHH
jgi:cytochrome c553